MAAKAPPRLVIDASLARAAGGSATVHPVSKNCRDFLEAVRTARQQYKIVMSPEISAEWNKHQSKFARTWRRSMVASKRLDFRKDCFDADLRIRLKDGAISENEWREIEKDCCLLEAALATDKNVVSLDENTARKLFTKACQKVTKLKEIVWVNPTKAEEYAIQWLEEGAKPEPHRKLGFQPEVR